MINNELLAYFGFGAVIASLGIIFLFIFLVFYVYIAFALMTIANKTKTPNAWLAWIPIANMYLMTQIAKVQWWTFLIALFATFIPFIGGFISIGIAIWWWWLIAERRKMPGWISLLLLIPFVNLVVIGYITWGRK